MQVPITFRDREEGESKLTMKQNIECVAVVVGVWLALGNRHRLSAAHSHQLH